MKKIFITCFFILGVAIAHGQVFNNLFAASKQNSAMDSEDALAVNAYEIGKGNAQSMAATFNDPESEYHPSNCNITVTNTIACHGYNSDGSGNYELEPTVNNNTGHAITSWTVTFNDASNNYPLGTHVYTAPLGLPTGVTASPIGIDYIDFYNPPLGSVSVTFTFTMDDGTICTVTQTVTNAVCPSCGCGNWPATIPIDYYPNGFVDASTSIPVPTPTPCGGTINVAHGSQIFVGTNFSAYNYICGAGCSAVIACDLIDLATGLPVMAGSTGFEYPLQNTQIGNIFEAPLNTCSNLKLLLKPTCTDGGTPLINSICPVCPIFINVICPCHCGTWQVAYTKNGEANLPIQCGQQINAAETDNFIFTASGPCTPDYCPKTTSTTIYKPDGSVLSTTPGLTVTFGPHPSDPLPYKVVFTSTCGTNTCTCVENILVHPCQCAPWKPNIHYTKNSVFSGNVTQNQHIQAIATDVVTVTAGVGCNYGSCPQTMSTTIYDANNVQVMTNAGLSITFHTTLTTCGTYKVVFNSTCGSATCSESVFIDVLCCSCPAAPGWNNLSYTLNGTPYYIHCGDVIQANEMDVFTGIHAGHICTGPPCDPGFTTTIYYPNGTVYSTVQGNITSFNAPNALHVCGLYKVVFRTTCSGQPCDECFFNINVACCGTHDIKMYDLSHNEVTGACITPGDYIFNVDPSLLPGDVINYTYTILPSGTTVSGTFNYSGAGLPLTVPLYACGSTFVKVSFSWYNGMCNALFQKPICVPPCCGFITETSKTLVPSVSSLPNSLDFTDVFTIAPPAATFSKVKVEILYVTVGGVAAPSANISGNIPAFTAQVNSGPLIPGAGTAAVWSQGNALWFNTPFTPFTGTITFRGTLYNASSVPAQVTLKLRYTFYKTDGTCLTICEKEVDFN